MGDDAGQPSPPSREVADVDLPPDDRGVATVAPPEEVIAPRRRFRERLGRSLAALSRGMAGLLAQGADDDEAWEELEEALLAADVGVATSTELVERSRTRARAERPRACPARAAPRRAAGRRRQLRPVPRPRPAHRAAAARDRAGRRRRP